MYNYGTEYVAIDIETTGLYPAQGDRIIEMAAVKIKDNVITGDQLQLYINPQGKAINRRAQEIHNISEYFLRDKPIFSKVIDQFLSFIEGCVIIVHNADFDINFINYELNMIQYDTISIKKVLDTLKLSRKLYPGGKNSLDGLCKRFGVNLSKREANGHGALIDAQLLAIVYLHLTSGTQKKFDLSNQGSCKIVSCDKSVFAVPRQICNVTSDEKMMHDELVTKIKNPIWKM